MTHVNLQGNHDVIVLVPLNERDMGFVLRDQ